MAKLLIFDVTGVLSSNEEDPFLEDLAKKNNLRLEELKKYYLELLEKAEKSEMTLEEVWGRVSSKFSIICDVKNIVQEMMSTKVFYDDILTYIQELSKDHWICYLTNYAKEYWEQLENKLKWNKYFDFGVVSYQIGERKPNQKGFDTILQHLEKTTEDTIFIDDSIKNVESATSFKIKSIHYKNLDNLKAELNRLLT